MVKKRIALVGLLVVVVLVVALFVLMAPRHVMIDDDMPVGEEVVLTSRGTPLAASFLKPGVAARRVPGVVMIVGSGSYSYRSSWRPGEFPLWKSISEAFLAKGYAVLLLEKKGVNRSGGHWETQTFHDRAGDAIAGVRYLRGRPEIDPARVGVCGHSQGGWIAQLAAAEDPGEIAFVANLAGPNVSVKRQVLDDQEYEWRCAGVGEDGIASKSRWLRRKLDVYGTISRAVRIGALSRIINYDPEAENVPARIACPILAIYGEYDRLVLPEGNIPLLEQGLRAGGNTRSRIVVVPKGSHGFIRKTTRCPEPVDGVPAMAPEFFQAVAGWDPFA
ncbi:MAG: alpha/beta fold hydrolase [Acidobacteriia bacterium]|nr:alpha/beta fold hydrolase [Terriglobia bacterium]